MNPGVKADGEWPVEHAAATDQDGVGEMSGAEPMPLPPVQRPWPEMAIAALLGVLALGWVASLVWGLSAAAASAGGITPLRLAAWIGIGSAPLALLALLFLLLVRSGRAEARAYSRASARLRADSEALGQMLTLLNQRIEDSRSQLQAHAGELQALGTDTTDRVSRAAAELRGQIEALGGAAATLDDATSIARADLGVLLADLPQAEAVARSLAERLREGSSEADARGRTLASLLEELDARGRAAGEATGGAAARLAGQLDRIEASAAAADKRIEDAALSIGRAVDAALEAAAEGVEETRRAVAGQSAALTAMVQQGQASLGAAGEDAVAALSGRIDALVARIDGIGSGLRGQELAARGLLGQLEEALGAVEARFESLGDKGAEHTADLAEAIVTLSEHADAISRTLGSSSQNVDTLVNRIGQLRAHAEASSTTIADAIPAALARMRLHTEQGLSAIATAKERTDGLEATAEAVAEKLAEGAALLEHQRQALDQAGTLGEQRLAALHEQAAALDAVLQQAASQAKELSDGATQNLIEALLRVRDTATQASEHAREALSAAIPRVAQRLSESASRALKEAFAEAGQEELASVTAASAQAIEAARQASERLSRQLVTIAETATAIEARIEENRTETEAHDEASFARAVSLLIEALNSASIDLARIFATEVSDEDWKAYLRGDRGVFTRRALRLLERTEAAAITQRYNEDADFRELVNRYVHDFESLLRRVMAAREGTAMATTMLSSDAGKLYVVVAQAIERLRK